MVGSVERGGLSVKGESCAVPSGLGFDLAPVPDSDKPGDDCSALRAGGLRIGGRLRAATRKSPARQKKAGWGTLDTLDTLRVSAMLKVWLSEIQHRRLQSAESGSGAKW